MIDKVKRALQLAEYLDISYGEHCLIQKRIPEAYAGDEAARGYIMRFAYDGKRNRQIVNDILAAIS